MTMPVPRHDLRESPWAYPGAPLSESIVLGVPGDGPGNWARLLARRQRRLGQACVRLADSNDLPLNYVLLTNNAPGIDSRRPVAAFGSNADPAVLFRKFNDAAVSTIVPMRVGRMANARLTTSAHVSAPGYLPAAAAHAPGQVLDVVVAWLDGAQLDCLDRTEPNYTRRRLDGTEHGIVLVDNDEQLAAAVLYDTRWGVLDVPDRPDAQIGLWRHVLATLPDVAALLEVRESTDDESIKDLMLRMGKDPRLREAVRDVLQRVARPGGLLGATDGAPPTYGSGASRWTKAPPVQGAGALEVVSTPDDIDRRGQVVVSLHPDAMASVSGSGHHAVVSPAISPAGGEHLAVLVALRSDARIGPTTLGVDQVARNALGVELTELATLRPAHVPRKRFADAVLGEPAYVTCRVQPADLTSVERQVCLVEPLTLGLLGVSTGDEVVVEGLPGADTEDVATKKVRAHAAPEAVLDRRMSLSGGTLESRFPSSRDALGVSPDLPWIFLDSATRTGLNVRGKLGTVRIRASRRYQLLRELRESLLLALLALVGLAQVITNPAILIGLTVAVLALSAGAVILRLRNRMAGSGSG